MAQNEKIKNSKRTKENKNANPKSMNKSNNPANAKRLGNSGGNGKSKGIFLAVLAAVAEGLLFIVASALVLALAIAIPYLYLILCGVIDSQLVNGGLVNLALRDAYILFVFFSLIYFWLSTIGAAILLIVFGGAAAIGNIINRVLKTTNPQKYLSRQADLKKKSEAKKNAAIAKRAKQAKKREIEMAEKAKKLEAKKVKKAKALEAEKIQKANNSRNSNKK